MHHAPSFQGVGFAARRYLVVTVLLTVYGGQV